MAQRALSGKKLAIIAAVDEGMTYQNVAEKYGVTVNTVRNLMNRDDVKRLQMEAMQSTLRAAGGRAAAVLTGQLSSDNPWIAQNAATRVLSLINDMENEGNAQVVVNFGGVDAPALPEKAEELIAAEPGSEVT